MEEHMKGKEMHGECPFKGFEFYDLEVFRREVSARIQNIQGVLVCIQSAEVEGRWVEAALHGVFDLLEGLDTFVDIRLDDQAVIERDFYQKKSLPRFCGPEAFLLNLKETQNFIQTGALGLHENLQQVKSAIDAIERFFDNTIKPILDIRAELDETGNDIAKQLRGGSQQKETPAEVSTADQNRSEDVEKVA